MASDKPVEPLGSYNELVHDDSSKPPANDNIHSEWPNIITDIPESPFKGVPIERYRFGSLGEGSILHLNGAQVVDWPPYDVHPALNPPLNSLLNPSFKPLVSSALNPSLKPLLSTSLTLHDDQPDLKKQRLSQVSNHNISIPQPIDEEEKEDKIILGRGAFGIAYLDKMRNIVIKKFLSKVSEEEKQKEYSSCDIIMKCPHASLVKILKISPISDEIEMEFCEGGTLLQEILKRKELIKPFTQREILQLIKDLCHGLKHLHTLGFIHKDISSRNILLCKGRFKISDFGLCSTRPGMTSRRPTNSDANPDESQIDFDYDIYGVGRVVTQAVCLSFKTKQLGDAAFERVDELILGLGQLCKSMCRNKGERPSLDNILPKLKMRFSLA